MAQTLWKLLRENNIEIPEIQRDYAQGRKSDRVKAIREKFVKDLLGSLQINGGDDSAKHLHLDFIFGQSVDISNNLNFERSRASLEQMIKVLEGFSEDNKITFEAKVGFKPIATGGKMTLIPIDGQQRLTTLLLLHWYIGLKANEDIQLLKKFTYKTRDSSTAFINNLIENGLEVIIEAELRNSSLSKIIIDQSWFFSSWKKDPTVSGMLVMLNEIQHQTSEWNERKFEIAWELLTKEETICFDFFDIREAGLEDDLYVKMNSRGKYLTDFENFKAWLQKRFKKENRLGEHWHKKLDKAWLDVMWSASSDIAGIDGNYLSFFENMALLYKLKDFQVKDSKLYYKASDEDIDESEQIKKADEVFKQLSNRKFTPAKYYEDNDVFNIDAVQFIFQIFTCFEEDRIQIDEFIQPIWNNTFYIPKDRGKTKITEALFSGFSYLDYVHKAFVYAVIKFLVVKGKSFKEFDYDDKAKFNDWLRVIRNLIYNSTSDAITFVQAVQSIDRLSEDVILDIKSYLKEQEKDYEWIGFFNRRQIEEERLKASLDEIWNNDIINAENHYYFYGQVLFIMNLSKDSEGDYNIEKFNYYHNRLSNLFDKSHLVGRDYLIQRALFVIDDGYGNWMKWLTAWRRLLYRSLRGNSRDRDENWRTLFREDKLEILRKLLHTCDCTTESLEALIEDKKGMIKDWRSYFIHEPKLIDYCEQKMINWGGSHFIRLLGSSRLSGYHVELRSYTLYLHLKKKEKFKDVVRYHSVKSNDDRACLIYKDKECSYFIKYVCLDTCEAGKFVYVEKPQKNEVVSEYKALNEDLPIYSEIIEFYMIHENTPVIVE